MVNFALKSCTYSKKGEKWGRFFREFVGSKESVRNRQDREFPCNEKKGGELGHIFS